MSMQLPQDDFILLSFVNTKLRDEFSSLSDFCENYGVEEGNLRTRLAGLGYNYDENANAFVRS